ncbi:MAG TPA: FAD-dependent oxidoreductase [Casimicrobiaceae bacterium]
MSSADEFDIAIVGGGLVGGAIGYGLARTGLSVALLDEGDVAYRASRGNFGLVWVQGKGLGLAPYSNWTQLSARRWPELAALLRADADTDVVLEQPGGFHLCLSERELQYRVQTLTRLVEQPGLERYPFDVLDHAALADRIPGIGPAVVGGTYTALDGHVNALKLLRALHAGFLKQGGVYLPNARIERARRSGERFDLQANNKTFRASKIVLASGLGNAQLAPQVGLAAPVRPQRGQILVLERVRRFLHHPIATLRQTDEGTVLVGDSQEEAGFNDSVGMAILATLADRAVRTFPTLRDVRINRTWAALRVMSPDGFPIYDQSRAHPGAFLATCHSGVTLAAAHALELAPQIVAGDLDPRLQPFSAERLNVQKAA